MSLVDGPHPTRTKQRFDLKATRDDLSDEVILLAEFYERSAI